MFLRLCRDFYALICVFQGLHALVFVLLFLTFCVDSSRFLRLRYSVSYVSSSARARVSQRLFGLLCLCLCFSVSYVSSSACARVSHCLYGFLCSCLCFSVSYVSSSTCARVSQRWYGFLCLLLRFSVSYKPSACVCVSQCLYELLCLCV